jgi:hypothetical protein
MNTVLLSALIAGGGLVISIVGAFFIAGYRRGVTDTAIENIRADIAEIKGLFQLTLTELNSRSRRR